MTCESGNGRQFGLNLAKLVVPVQLGLAILLDPAGARAIPVDTWELTLRSLDSVTSTIIGTDTVAGDFTNYFSTTPTGSLSIDVPGNVKYFARASTLNNFLGAASATTTCSTQPNCLDASELPSFLELDFQVSKGFTLNSAAVRWNVGYEGAEGVIRSVETGNELSFSGDGLLPFSWVMAESLTGRSCIGQPTGSQCEFVVEWRNLPDTLSAFTSLNLTPEPSSALLIGIGLIGLAIRRR